MTVRILRWTKNQPSEAVTALLQRPAFDAAAEEAAAAVLRDIRTEGLSAILRYAKKFDGADLLPAELAVPEETVAAAKQSVDPAFLDAAQLAYERVTTFAEAGLKQNWKISTPKGGVLGEQFTPLSRVGVYVPGGTAPLASTALMTATLAKVAGVKEIVACTPCGPDKTVNPFLLHALRLAGATEIYRVGGTQAIGLMAFGAPGTPPVQKIVGPGNAYVTAAKRQVYGYVGIDLVAGPSEIAILADESAEPAHIAADLLSQAEHGSGHEKALLVTTSLRIAEEVQHELDSQVKTLSRKDIVEKVMQNGIVLAVADSMDEGMDLCNLFAPEHFELLIENPESWLAKVKCAGAVFMGTWTPEAVGDFVAGPSHVLPTGGAAAMFSGLTVDDFRKRTSFINFTRDDLEEVLPAIEAFGAVEGLDAHAKSARIRFE